MRDPVKLQVHDPFIFGVLGPFQVRLDDHAVAVKATKQRALLAALVLHANQPVTVDELTDLLWDGCSPPGARGTVQAYVMRLRGVLGGPGRRMLGTVAGGYQLSVPPDAVDLTRFERLTEQGERSAAAGQLATASQEFSQALALWRGPPLADVDSGLLRRTEVPRLDEQRMLATERRIELDLALGRHRQVISEVRELVSRYPLRERYWYLLMQALHRSGWRADALAAYRSAREVITRELGVEPGEALRELHQVVLTGNRDPGGGGRGRVAGDAAECGDAGGASTVRALNGGHRSGDAGTGTPAVDGKGAAARRPASQGAGRGGQGAGRGGATAPGHDWAGQCQLPMEVPGFVGRAADTGEIAAALTSRPGVPVVVLSGPPGAGKTALAVRVAHQVRAEFPDGQLYVPLTTYRGVREPAQILASVLAATGLPADAIPPDRAALGAVFRARLADRRVLLVLDCARDGRQVRPLLPGTPGSAVLVTSHSELRSLCALSGACRHPLGPLRPAESLRLLTLIIGAGRVAADPAAAGQIAGLCGHLPLALRIAAASLTGRPGLPLRDYAAELDGGRMLDLLTIDGDRAASVAVSFGRCYDSLPPGLQRWFATLAARSVSGPTGSDLSGSDLGGSDLGGSDLGGSDLGGSDVTVPASAEVLGVPASEAASVLDGLAEHGLLLPAGPGRYRFLGLLRRFALEKALDARAPLAENTSLTGQLTGQASLAGQT